MGDGDGDGDGDGIGHGGWWWRWWWGVMRRLCNQELSRDGRASITSVAGHYIPAGRGGVGTWCERQWFRGACIEEQGELSMRANDEQGEQMVSEDMTKNKKKN